jgi:type I restriction enzyme S subunit
MNWKPTKLSEFLTERDGRIKCESANQLGLQRIKKIDFSGNIHLDAETDTKTDMIRVKSGDLVVSGINAAKGAIAVHAEGEDVLATIHYSAYEFNPDRISVDFLKWFFKSSEFSDLLKEQIPGGIKTELKPKHILPLQVKLPKLSEQIKLAERLNRFRLEQLKLEHEITNQQSLLAKLKQAILQEAIQGKLTADWRAAYPEVEPASQLLLRIQPEKARLIADKKLRPEKPLPKITPAEIPFEIPKGWEWCRLGDINLKYLGGEAYQSNSIIPSGNNQVVRIGNIKPDVLELSKRPAFISDSLAEETSASRLQPGDILITMTGTYQKKDYCFTVLLTEEHFKDKRLYQNQRVGCFRLHPEIHKPFLIRAIKLASLLNPVFESATGAANQANISKIALLKILIPLPPLAEQAAIVERVEALMTTCRALEAEIEQSRTHAAHLLQVVLKEAFAPASA